MSQLIDKTLHKSSVLQELKQAHAKTLLVHACRAQFNREPTNPEITYWVGFLLSGGELRDMVKRLPEGPGELIELPPSQPTHSNGANMAFSISASDPMVASVSDIAKAPVIALTEEIKQKFGAHQGVISLVGNLGLFYAGRPAKIHVLVENLSALTWVSGEVQPVFACYHWIDQTGNVIIYDGIRSRLPEAIEPAARKQVPVSIIAPPVAGDYTLEVTLVHEQLVWMEEDGLTTLRLAVTVDPSLSESGLKILKELQWAKESATAKFQ